MAQSNQSEIHPLVRLGVAASEIEKRTKRRALRPNISLVIHRHRDRLGWDAYQAIKEVFPSFDVEAAMKWKWAEHGGLVPLGSRPSRERVKRGGRRASR